MRMNARITGDAMSKRAALYLRVSTDKQTVENQRAALTAIAERRGWQIVTTYTDAGISGTKDLFLEQQSIDTTTPSGKLMFQIVGAFAEFERSMIRQRIHAGLKRAVAEGKILGRPQRRGGH